MEEIKYYPDSPVPISQYEEEFSKFLDLFLDFSPKNILEIGTHYGGTLYQWAKHSEDWSTIVAVDDYHLNENLYRGWKNRTKKIIPIKGNSHDKAIIDLVSMFAPYDFIFIDGDHSYKGVLKDWQEYSQMLKPKSFVAFHDILHHPHSEVSILWEEIKYDYIHYEFISQEGQDGCGIGVIFK